MMKVGIVAAAAVGCAIGLRSSNEQGPLFLQHHDSRSPASPGAAPGPNIGMSSVTSIAIADATARRVPRRDNRGTGFNGLDLARAQQSRAYDAMRGVQNAADDLRHAVRDSANVAQQRHATPMVTHKEPMPRPSAHQLPHEAASGDLLASAMELSRALKNGREPEVGQAQGNNNSKTDLGSAPLAGTAKRETGRPSGSSPLAVMTLPIPSDGWQYDVGYYDSKSGVCRASQRESSSPMIAGVGGVPTPIEAGLRMAASECGVADGKYEGEVRDSVNGGRFIITNITDESVTFGCVNGGVGKLDRREGSWGGGVVEAELVGFTLSRGTVFRDGSVREIFVKPSLASGSLKTGDGFAYEASGPKLAIGSCYNLPPNLNPDGYASLRVCMEASAALGHVGGGVSLDSVSVGGGVFGGAASWRVINVPWTSFPSEKRPVGVPADSQGTVPHIEPLR